MKLALVLGLVNPNIGGILLVGPRGTAKTTAVRSLIDLLPMVKRSACQYGCLPEDIEEGGLDAVCPDCAKKYGEGLSLTNPDRVRLIELPLNAKLENVIGGMDERAAMHSKMRLKRGILAQADKNLLYIDEVNLLGDDVIDAILDAAAQGSYTLRRGAASATYRSRFLLVGSMNPEEGNLRPQIMDRFGLRVIVRGLEDSKERLKAYRRVQDYLNAPRQVIGEYAEALNALRDELEATRNRLQNVRISTRVAKKAIGMIQELGIDSLRAEITWFEAARAHAAASGRITVKLADLHAVAPMALRLRRSEFINEYFAEQKGEEEELEALIKPFKRKRRTAKKRI
ncbi:MAG: magnesium chelatase [Anaerolineae bacterium]|nr:magnesium chelatase [Anaerolineae bacterium]MBT4311534.1 magnesium chelatase [Anaerolineae bacterium]MBT4459657.1 magnesium chelatase [Anaerolineae bacterium]MBT4841586.1 magnesium chelatase [Anaerolineae bacterium]MBT6059690.1 magnesium chelatase [Anaerolineae bacterium]